MIYIESEKKNYERTNMKIGIVGSREFPQLNLIDQFISDLSAGVSIVSGGLAYMFWS